MIRLGLLLRTRLDMLIRCDRPKQGIDCKEVIAPVSISTSAPTLLSAGCALDFQIHVMI